MLQNQITANEIAPERNKVLRNTFGLLGLTMIPTVIGAVVGMQSGFLSLAQQSPIATLIVSLIAVFGLLFATFKNKDSGLGIVFLLMFCGVMGITLSGILTQALHLKNGAQLIGMAFGGTGVTFMVLAGIAANPKRDFSGMGNFLFVGLTLLIIASIANLFFHIPALDLAIAGAGVLIFSGYILYDVNQIVTGGETNYIIATVQLYLDVMNLFINLLKILMALLGSRD